MKLSYFFWVFWIGLNCRRSGLVYNIEYRKCYCFVFYDLGIDMSDEIEEK